MVSIPKGDHDNLVSDRPGPLFSSTVKRRTIIAADGARIRYVWRVELDAHLWQCLSSGRTADGSAQQR